LFDIISDTFPIIISHRSPSAPPPTCSRQGSWPWGQLDRPQLCGPELNIRGVNFLFWGNLHFDRVFVYLNSATTIEAVTSRTAAQFEWKACPVAQKEERTRNYSKFNV